MATPYRTLLAGLGIRLNALVGGKSDDLEATYATTPLLAANWESADFPFTWAKDAIIQAESRYAWTIANTGDHPWRAVLRGLTVPLVHKAAIPAVSAASQPIVGIYGAIYDGTDGTACTEAPLELIRRRVRNANGHYRCAVYNYKIDGGVVYHTRTSVIIEVCTFDAAAQLATLNANGNMLLPDVLAEGIMDEAAGTAHRDDMFAQQAAQRRQQSAEWLTAIQSGLTSVAAKATPGPTLSQGAT